jgi:transcriptional regulator with XRE-family HTH domain
MSASTEVWRLWGRWLRRFRERAGLTQEELAEQVHYSLSTVSAVERGERRPAPELSTRCDEVLDTGGVLEELRTDLASWSSLPTWFGAWREVEQQATHVRNYEPLVVPGLLQTEAYARGLIVGDEDLIRARLDRQHILHRDEPAPPMLWCVVDEGVLARPVGGPKVMIEQLERLADAAEESRITVQVVSLGVHRGLMSAFWLAETDGQPVGYVDTALRGIVTTDSSETRQLEIAWQEIVAEALPARASLELIRRSAQQWQQQT